MPPNLNVAHGWYYNIYLSERLKRIAEDNSLTGIDFLWVKDIGRFQAQQWYIPVLQYTLGRGIDHPWFDSTTLQGPNSNQPTHPIFRCGTSHFKVSQIKKDVIFEKKVYSEIISLFDPNILYISSYRRFLREYLPKTDFAYIWRTGELNHSGDAILRQRDLCISRRAKDILLQNKIISVNQLEPICIYDSLPEGVEIINENLPYPIPSYSKSNIDIGSLKVKLDIEWKKYLSKPKQNKKITIQQALSLLTKSTKNRPHDFRKALSKRELELNAFSLPEYWLEILNKVNGCFLNEECELIPLKDIEEFTKDRQAYLHEVNENYSQDLIHVGMCVNGDWYSIKKDDSSSTDSVILRISHETCQPIEQWESIATFLYDMLSDYRG